MLRFFHYQIHMIYIIIESPTIMDNVAQSMSSVIISAKLKELDL